MSRDGSPATKTYPHPCFVYAAQYHPQRKNLIITGGYDRHIRIWSNDSEGVNGQVEVFTYLCVCGNLSWRVTKREG